MLEVRVTKLFDDSTVAKILELVENASSRKAKAEAFITRFARVYTPIVVLSALATSTTWNFPVVKVPVLSNTTVSRDPMASR